ncbi:unnamed protein product [Thelazia callipaeda]|uniref:Ovule protein n=1 Tax=Thelazia callipaeda TaxID=103827 RepID=A0A0N5CWJ5_THECL|nr:unnamed protein product [Thelazia callipaeda]
MEQLTPLHKHNKQIILRIYAFASCYREVHLKPYKDSKVGLRDMMDDTHILPTNFENSQNSNFADGDWRRSNNRWLDNQRQHQEEPFASVAINQLLDVGGAEKVVSNEPHDQMSFASQHVRIEPWNQKKQPIKPLTHYPNSMKSEDDVSPKLTVEQNGKRGRGNKQIKIEMQNSDEPTDTDWKQTKNIKQENDNYSPEASGMQVKPELPIHLVGSVSAHDYYSEGAFAANAADIKSGEEESEAANEMKDALLFQVDDPPPEGSIPSAAFTK